MKLQLNKLIEENLESNNSQEYENQLIDQED